MTPTPSSSLSLSCIIEITSGIRFQFAYHCAWHCCEQVCLGAHFTLRVSYCGQTYMSTMPRCPWNAAKSAAMISQSVDCSVRCIGAWQQRISAVGWWQCRCAPMSSKDICSIPWVSRSCFSAESQTTKGSMFNTPSTRKAALYNKLFSKPAWDYEPGSHGGHIHEACLTEACPQAKRMFTV